MGVIVNRQLMVAGMRVPRSIRRGRTAPWPASACWMTYNDRKVGVYLRIGNRAWSASLMPLGRGR